MQIQFDDIASGERLLRQVREKEFVDDTRACDAYQTLLLPGGMRGHHHTTQYAIGSHRDLWAVVQRANHLTFGTLLNLIGRQVQPRLNEWMVEQVIVLAARHKRKASHIGEHRSIAILPIEPEQRAFW